MLDPTRRSLLGSSLFGVAVGVGLVRAGRAQDGVTAPAKSSTPTAAKSAPALRKAVKYDMIAIEGSVLDRFQLAKECGFEGVELDSPYEIDRQAVVDASAKTGVLVHGVIDSVHWQTRFSDPSPAVRERAVAALRGAIADAKTYGASTVLVVPGAVRDAEKENFQ
ncbi:MAG: TIM barrel protein, partial [Planctomycetota bacterium]|nr:TIM barrel protein [Planctomycetota bacterium]